MTTSTNHIDYFVSDRFIRKYMGYDLQEVILLYNHSEVRSPDRRRLSIIP